MFYKFATAFACFFVLGQAMADENLAGKGKGLAEEQGPIGAVSKGAQDEQGPLGADVGKGAAGEQGPIGADVGKGAAGEQGPIGADVGKGVSEEQGPLGPNVGMGPSEEQGPLGPNVGAGPSEEQGPLGPNVGMGPSEEQGPGAFKGGAGKRTEIAPITGTFDQLKLACDDPGAFHFQLQPDNIRIACSSRETKWVPNGDGGLQLDCTRIVQGDLYSNKILVDKETYAVAVPPNALTCPSFKEVEMIYSSQYGTNCDELRAYTDLGQFCEERLTSDPNAIQELVQVQDTGRLVDTCPGANVGPITK